MASKAALTSASDVYVLGAMTPEDFRREATDHLPVTAGVAVVEDRD